MGITSENTYLGVDKISNNNYRLAFEIGATKILAMCVDPSSIDTNNPKLNYALVVNENTVTGRGKGDDFVNQLIRLGEAALREARVDKAQLDATDVGSPGPLDSRLGILQNPANFKGMGDVQVVEPLRDHFGVDTYLDNDVATAAAGELIYGIGRTRGSRNFVVITSGTGLGGGVIADGRLPGGYQGNFGEIGHATIDYSAEARADGCTENNDTRPVGHWEAYCAASWFAKWAVDELKQEPNPQKSELYQYVQSSRNLTSPSQVYASIRSEDVFQAYREGDPFAMSMVEKFREMHARGLAHLITHYNPEFITLMGPLHIYDGDIVLHNEQPDGSKEMYHLARMALARCYSPDAMKPENLIVTSLGHEIGLFGAIALADFKREQG